MRGGGPCCEIPVQPGNTESAPTNPCKRHVEQTRYKVAQLVTTLAGVPGAIHQSYDGELPVLES